MIFFKRKSKLSSSCSSNFTLFQLNRRQFVFFTRGVLSGPGVSVCKSRYDIVIWRAENRTHLSKQTRPSTERSRRASNVSGIPSRLDDQLRWVLIVRTQVHDMGGELPYSQTSRLNHTIDYLITLT